jgi:DNA-binding FrmR family transcriptional regulator
VKPGYYNDKEEVLAGLRRIEGQVRGLQRLVAEDRYCIDVLTQISAVSAGLKKAAVQLLEDHISHCVADSIAGGNDPGSKITEVTTAVERLLKV